MAPRRRKVCDHYGSRAAAYGPFSGPKGSFYDFTGFVLNRNGWFSDRPRSVSDPDGTFCEPLRSVADRPCLLCHSCRSFSNPIESVFDLHGPISDPFVAEKNRYG